MAKKPKLHPIGAVLLTRWFVPGYPCGIPTDARVVVRARRAGDRQGRYRVERDDGREGSWWVDGDSLRQQGEP